MENDVLKMEFRTKEITPDWCYMGAVALNIPWLNGKGEKNYHWTAYRTEEVKGNGMVAINYSDILIKAQDGSEITAEMKEFMIPKIEHAIGMHGAMRRVERESDCEPYTGNISYFIQVDHETRERIDRIFGKCEL